MKNKSKKVFFYCMFVFSCCAIVHCDTNTHALNYIETPTQRGKEIRITYDHWSFQFPDEWKIVDKGEKGKATFIQLMRKSGPSASAPVCLITYEPSNSGMQLKEYMLKKLTKITAQLMRSGYKINRSRDDIVDELTLRCTKKPILGFSYELIAPSSQKNIRSLAIALFTNDKETVCSIIFELPQTGYEKLKREIVSIVK